MLQTTEHKTGTSIIFPTVVTKIISDDFLCFVIRYIPHIRFLRATNRTIFRSDVQPWQREVKISDWFLEAEQCKW